MVSFYKRENQIIDYLNGSTLEEGVSIDSLINSYKEENKELENNDPEDYSPEDYRLVDNKRRMYHMLEEAVKAGNLEVAEKLLSIGAPTVIIYNSPNDTMRGEKSWPIRNISDVFTDKTKENIIKLVLEANMKDLEETNKKIKEESKAIDNDIKDMANKKLKIPKMISSLSEKYNNTFSKLEELYNNSAVTYSKTLETQKEPESKKEERKAETEKTNQNMSPRTRRALRKIENSENKNKIEALELQNQNLQKENNELANKLAEKSIKVPGSKFQNGITFVKNVNGKKVVLTKEDLARNLIKSGRTQNSEIKKILIRSPIFKKNPEIIELYAEEIVKAITTVKMYDHNIVKIKENDIAKKGFAERLEKQRTQTKQYGQYREY